MVGVFRDFIDHVFRLFLRKRSLPLLGFWSQIGSKRVSIDRILHVDRESGTSRLLSLPVLKISVEKYELGPSSRVRACTRTHARVYVLVMSKLNQNGAEQTRIMPLP